MRGSTSAPLSDTFSLYLADTRQDPFPEQFERAHHRIDIASAGILQRQVDHAGADFLATAPELLDDPVGTAAEADWQYAPNIRGPPLAGDIARGVRLKQRIA